MEIIDTMDGYGKRLCKSIFTISRTCIRQEATLLGLTGVLESNSLVTRLVHKRLCLRWIRSTLVDERAAQILALTAGAYETQEGRESCHCTTRNALTVRILAQ